MKGGREGEGERWRRREEKERTLTRNYCLSGNSSPSSGVGTDRNASDTALLPNTVILSFQ